MRKFFGHVPTHRGRNPPLQSLSPGIRAVTAIVLLLVVLGIAGCTDLPRDQGKAAPLEVAVTLLPQAEMVSAVGGERVCVTVVVPPGTDPHTFEPAASQMVKLSQAEIYFRLGPGLLPFEDTLVDRILEMNPEIVVVDSSEGISLLSGDEEGERYDPHIWLSLSNAGVIVGNIRKGFVLADPSFAEYYAGREQQYKERIGEADASIRASLAGTEGAAFLVTHPAWGYFAQEHELVQIAVEAEGKEPSAREISTLISRAREEGIHVIFVEPQFSTRESEVIAREINGSVVFIDPLSPDYLTNLQRVASAIAVGASGG